MYHATHKTDGRGLSRASGEQLLLMAVFGPKKLKPGIDRELDRRALHDTAHSVSDATTLGVRQGGYAA